MFQQNSSITIDKYPVPDEGTKIITRINFKNGGATPAYDVRLTSISGRINGFNEKSIAYAEMLYPPPVVSASYAFGDANVLQDAPSKFTYSKSAISEIMQRIGAPFVYFGELTWIDVFRKNHCLHFCFIIADTGHFSNDPTSSVGPERCSFYNDTDESD